MTKLAPNGRTLRTFKVGEYWIREVEFRPDEGFPLCLGYAVGETDDGHSTLYLTPEEALRASESRREPK